MTHQTSNLGRKAAALVLGAALLAPTAFVFAEEGPSVRTNVGVKVQLKADAGLNLNFCTNLAKLETSIANRIPKREEKRDDRLDTRIAKVGNHFQLRLTKLEDHRSDWDKNRIDRYTKMEARASTTAQIAAVATFKTNVDAAVKVRRAAVDSAVKTFQDGVNKLLAGRQTTVDAAFAKLKTDTSAAIAKAKEACANGTDPMTIRTTLATDLKVANDAFSASIKPSTTLESQVNALRVTRDAAVKAAIEAFNKVLDAELVKLKAAFGVSA